MEKIEFQAEVVATQETNQASIEELENIILMELENEEYLRSYIHRC